jgi:hypothetical protein
MVITRKSGTLGGLVVIEMDEDFRISSAEINPFIWE